MASALEVDLADKVILITGAAGGIGRVLVKRSLTAGAFVAAFDIHPEIHQRLNDHPRLLTIQGDASHEPDVIRCLTQLSEAWQRLDVLINNAGQVGSGRVESLSLEEWQSVLDANLTSAFLFSKHSIPWLKRSQGSIVSLSSTNAITGGSSLSGPAYAAAKAGIIALTKNMARDLAKDGVRVNAIAPGPIDTPMLDRLSEEEMNLLRESIPLCEIGTADDVANLVIFLISPAARHVTGVTISLSGGLVMN